MFSVGPASSSFGFLRLALHAMHWQYCGALLSSYAVAAHYSAVKHYSQQRPFQFRGVSHLPRKFVSAVLALLSRVRTQKNCWMRQCLDSFWIIFANCWRVLVIFNGFWVEVEKVPWRMVRLSITVDRLQWNLGLLHRELYQADLTVGIWTQGMSFHLIWNFQCRV